MVGLGLSEALSFLLSLSLENTSKLDGHQRGSGSRPGSATYEPAYSVLLHVTLSSCRGSHSAFHLTVSNESQASGEENTFHKPDEC